MCGTIVFGESQNPPERSGNLILRESAARQGLRASARAALLTVGQRPLGGAPI